MSDFTISQLIRSRRNSISIQIDSQGKLIVKAPFLMPKFLINRFIAQKSDWITKRIKTIQDHQPQIAKQYAHGEEYIYLGNTYFLEIGSYKEISISDKLYFPKVLSFRIKKELENWYMRQAKQVITQRVNYHAREMNTSFTGLTFSDTKSKWGSCSPDNALQFNWRLIMAPLMVLNYVVIHELAHTKHKNHSRKFWNEVGKYTPAFRQHRKWLHANSHKLVI